MITINLQNDSGVSTDNTLNPFEYQYYADIPRLSYKPTEGTVGSVRDGTDKGVPGMFRWQTLAHKIKKKISCKNKITMSDKKYCSL